MLQGQQLALLRQFAGPVLLLSSLELLVFRTAFSLLILMPVVVVLMLDLWALTWVAMRFSLAARSINEVLLKSLFWVLLLPWVLCMAGWPGFQTSWRLLAGGDITFVHRVWFWFAIAVAIDLALVLGWARPQLLRSSLRAPQAPVGPVARSLSLARLTGSWRLGPEL